MSAVEVDDVFSEVAWDEDGIVVVEEESAIGAAAVDEVEALGLVKEEEALLATLWYLSATRRIVPEGW